MGSDVSQDYLRVSHCNNPEWNSGTTPIFPPEVLSLILSANPQMPGEGTQWTHYSLNNYYWFHAYM